MCFGCSKEASHRGSSFEYPHHMFWMRNKENSFPIGTLIWRPVCVCVCVSSEGPGETKHMLKLIRAFDAHQCDNTVKPVLSCHSKIDKTEILMTNGSLMKVESIAECLGAFCIMQ